METEMVEMNGKQWEFSFGVSLDRSGDLNVSYTRTSPTGGKSRGEVYVDNPGEALEKAVLASFEGRGKNGQLEEWTNPQGEAVVEGFGAIGGDEDLDLLAAAQSIQDLMEMEEENVASLRWLRENIKKFHVDWNGNEIDYSIGRYRVVSGAAWVEPLVVND